MLIVLIHNDATGDSTIGNYDVEVRINYRTVAFGRIEGHRRSDGWRELIRRVATESEDLGEGEAVEEKP